MKIDTDILSGYRVTPKLAALYLHLYDVTDRDHIRYVYSTLLIVEREEKAGYGAHHSLDLCLTWTNALTSGDRDVAINL